MERYIKKSALVAEIERRIKEIDEIGTYLSPKGVLTNILCHLDTLEVKEVDIWTELCNLHEHYRNRETGYTDFNVAVHFFELGLKAQKGE